VDSGRFRLDFGGFWWIPVDFGGFRWIPVFSDTGFDFEPVPLQPNGDALHNNIDELNVQPDISPIEKFRHISIEHHFTHSAINDLLKFIQTYDKSFPSDARTLLKCKLLEFTIDNVSGGQYLHFNFTDLIINSLMKIEKCSLFRKIITDGMYLKINCDGLPLHKSSSSQFWPILCHICTVDNQVEEGGHYRQ